MDEATKAYYDARPCRHKLLHNGSYITGIGKTTADAVSDALRQSQMGDFGAAPKKRGRKKRESVKSKEKPQKTVFKYHLHRSIYWHKAIQLLIERVGVSDIATTLGVGPQKILNWKAKLTSPMPDVHDALYVMLIENLTKQELYYCNLQVGE